MSIKMIVTDLDNTLLHRDKTISDYTRDVFNRRKAWAVKNLPATASSKIQKACGFI
jgi:hydroxymethylpyrimidine pyrophosphatase-like HAD family hydrolase